MWNVCMRESERWEWYGTVRYIDVGPVNHTRRPMSVVLNRIESINHLPLTQKGPYRSGFSSISLMNCPSCPQYKVLFLTREMMSAVSISK